MNRRNFLRRALTGVAVAAVASKIPFETLTSAKNSLPATIGEYAEYSNFSSLAESSSIDELVEKSAMELAYRAGQNMANLTFAVVEGYQPVAFGA